MRPLAFFTSPALARRLVTFVRAAAAAARAFFAGFGLVHREGAAVLLLAVEGADGGLGLFVRSHLHEAEALAAAGLAVLDDFGAVDRAVRREHRVQVFVGD